ncbi:hypothetical protein WA026_015172 [Henosepilachna vigintioctopunctata]|uniref:Enolase-phosphatase E1 n=1 Tax=Henosepilachna vigintioctopunctata TaxID=420089 RepID=A0AAW1TVS7_9CUCU
MSDGNKNVESLNFEKVTAILLDVAGTTTAINFVKDTLLPYVTKSVDEFLKSSWEDEEVKKAVSQFEEKDLDVTKATEIVKTLTEKNDSNVGLKTIQGLIFKKGYESGELKGHVFADVPKSLEIWSKSRKIAIFSTGSVDSQQLLFKNTVEGDISSHISKYFDQSVGVKNEEASYKKIAEELDVIPENILFLTDDAKEAVAAKSANLTVVLVERDGNSPIPEDILSSFVVIKSFTDIPVESVKRKIEEDSVEQPPTKIAKVEVVGIVEEVTKKEEKVENKTKVEEINDEAMEVDVDEKSTEKPECDNGNNTTEKISEEVSITEEKSNTEEKSPVEESVSLNEEKHSNDSKTELIAVETEKSSSEKESVSEKNQVTEEKPVTEENPVKDESMNQEKQIAPVEKSETMEVEQTVESEMKEGLTKQCTETEKHEGGKESEKHEGAKETEKLEEIKETEKLEEAEETEKVLEKTETSKTETVEVKESTGTETLNEPNVPENKKESKSEIEIGTQTKTITNECETQTTISIKVAEELPAKEVQAKLMASTSENKKVDMEITEAKNIDDITDKTETNGDRIDEEKETNVDNICDSIDTKKDLVTNGTGEENGIIECKLEKTKADNSNKSEEKVSEVEEQSKEIKDNNTIAKVNETQQTNGDISKENGVSEIKSITADVVIEEKENKSDLANGTDNCISNGEASSSAVDSVEIKEEEIKIKTIEDKVEITPVSVEA